MADLRRLHLLQLASPALPVGGFSYAEGLEVLVQQGRLPDGQAVLNWLTAEITRGQLPVEAASLGPLMDALAQWRSGGEPQTVADWDQWLLAQREAPAIRQQQRQMGRSLLQLLAALGWPLPDPEAAATLAWPTAWAWAALCLELEPLTTVETYLYSWTANQLSAAVRLVPLGPTEAQHLQLALAPRLADRALELLAVDPRELWSAGLGASLAQLQHAELYSRLFRS